MKDMSDSVKLRLERGILFLIFSYLILIVGVVSIFLAAIIDELFVFIVFASIFIFILFLAYAIAYFEDAIKTLKDELKK